MVPITSLTSSQRKRRFSIVLASYCERVARAGHRGHEMEWRSTQYEASDRTNPEGDGHKLWESGGQVVSHTMQAVVTLEVVRANTTTEDVRL